MQSKIYEKIENNPKDFRLSTEEPEEVKRKMKYLELHLKDAIDFEETKEEMEAVGSLAVAHHKMGDYETATSYYKRQLKLGKKTDDEVSCRRAHCNLGIIFKNKGDLVTSVTHFNKALSIAKKRGETYAEGRIYNNLANLCELQMNYDKAIKYHQKRIEIARERSNKDSLSKSFAALGSLYHITGNYEQSIESYTELLTTLRAKLSKSLQVLEANNFWKESFNKIYIFSNMILWHFCLRTNFLVILYWGWFER